MEAIIILFWISCTIAAIVISVNKKEGCSGTIIAFLLGPLALIIALLSKGNRKQCEFCKEYMDKKAIVCPKCQRTITANNLV